MNTRMLFLVLLFGSSSTVAWAQGGSCTLIHPWELSGGAGCVTPPPSSGWTAEEEYLQATYGGAGPTCTYTPDPYYGGCWYGDCYSVGYSCGPGQNPSTPPVRGCPPGTCSAGEPIALANGNVYIRQSDIRIPGLGGGLELTRTWNSTWSFAPTVGMFGTQWLSTYEERLAVGSGGMMSYARADGSTWTFAFYGNPGAFHLVAPANVQLATLTESGTSSPVWAVTFENGEQRVFNGLDAGPLSAIVDRNGNATTLSYDANGRLTTVTDAAGRHLNFSYGSGSSNLVTNVTSDAGTGINLTYAYQTGSQLGLQTLLTNSFLVQVTQSDNSFVTFGYTPYGLIANVNDGNGKVLEAHTYGPAGCNAGLSSTRANGVDALTMSFSNMQYSCSSVGVGGP